MVSFSRRQDTDTKTTTTEAKENTTMIKKASAKKAAAAITTTTEATTTTTSEAKGMKFESDVITVMGIAKKAAAYGISDKDGSVYAFVEIDGTPVRIHVGKENKYYAEAKKAAQEHIAAYNAAKKAAAPKAVKTLDEYIASGINGDGWKFVFDESSSRTRLVFEKAPTEKQIAAITEAGFYYSKAMNSYNKKLTLKAAAAAEQLAKKL